jgi:radical SAM superfamily enzyme YgiQ (UPF0313 family)
MPVSIPKVNMARVILINPPSNFKVGAPLISQMYLASALLKSGHEVKIIDLEALYYRFSLDRLIDEISSYQPDVIGMGLYTSTVNFVYELVAQIKPEVPENVLLVAGGPHTTAVPEEPLRYGFDISVRGEGEVTLNELLEFCNEKNQLKKINGISFKTSSGVIEHCKVRPMIDDLNELPLAVDCFHLVNPNWYFKNGNMVGLPACIITSRGCPGKCTFCANIVSGRRFRYRKPGNIIEEMKYYHDNYGTTFFSFLDDSFTYDFHRVIELCEKFIQVQKSDTFEFQWSCITRSDRLSKRLLEKLKEAGCISINFGVESGSPETLRKIRKGIELSQVKKSLRWCKEVGIRSQVNFMLGFPWENEKHLKETLDFMKLITPLVDAFSSGGVVTPYPGTELYESYKDQYGLSNWWLQKEGGLEEARYSYNDMENQIISDEMVTKVYLEDPILDMDFFKYSPDVKKMIERCLEYKGKRTLEKLGIM